MFRQEKLDQLGVIILILSLTTNTWNVLKIAPSTNVASFPSLLHIIMDGIVWFRDELLADPRPLYRGDEQVKVIPKKDSPLRDSLVAWQIFYIF